MVPTYKRTLVTSALPYANGPVHIGHLAGCYLPSDIFVRYKRSKGEDVMFICGSDEHGVPITIKAKKEGISPQDVVDKYHKMMGDSFREFGISFDIYGRTSDPAHHKMSQDFFLHLYKEGKFIEEVRKLKEVVEFYNISGDFDFMLKILAPNMDEFHEFFVNKLSEIEGIGQTKSIFVMNSIKESVQIV